MTSLTSHPITLPLIHDFAQQPPLTEEELDVEVETQRGRKRRRHSSTAAKQLPSNTLRGRGRRRSLSPVFTQSESHSLVTPSKDVLTAIGKDQKGRSRREGVLDGQAIESRSPTPDRTLQKIAASKEKENEPSSFVSSIVKPAEKKQRRSQSPSRSRSQGEKSGPRRRRRTRSRGRAHDDGRMSSTSLVQSV
ncbi:hypothetical protein BGZ60DRAFT_220717 [Tricladium varicosporioides]|nr:hypothetical protein BGZ60DRAFT_220717 [Hymenoscyphus varicosporioides]